MNSRVSMDPWLWRQRCHSHTELSKEEKERFGFRSTAAGGPEELQLSQPWKCPRPGLMGPWVTGLVCGTMAAGWNAMIFKAPPSPTHAMAMKTLLWWNSWRINLVSPMCKCLRKQRFKCQSSKQGSSPFRDKFRMELNLYLGDSFLMEKKI